MVRGQISSVLFRENDPYASLEVKYACLTIFLKRVFICLFFLSVKGDLIKYFKKQYLRKPIDQVYYDESRSVGSETVQEHEGDAYSLPDK